MAQTSLTAWKFDSPDGAEHAGRTLEQLARDDVLTVQDVATVSWNDGETKPTTHQLSSTTPAGELGGGFWGMLFGLIFFLPLLGAALGAATGTLAGSLSDVGIDDGFINKVRDQITPGTSAMFVMTTSDAVVDDIRDAVKGHEPSELIYTKLSSEQAAALRQVFEQE